MKHFNVTREQKRATLELGNKFLAVLLTASMVLQSSPVSYAFAADEMIEPQAVELTAEPEAEPVSAPEMEPAPIPEPEPEPEPEPTPAPIEDAVPADEPAPTDEVTSEEAAPVDEPVEAEPAEVEPTEAEPTKDEEKADEKKETAASITISLSHATLYVADQTLSTNGTIKLPEGKDARVVVVADDGYELDAVKLTAGGQTSTISVAEDGSFTLPAAAAKTGTTISVTTKAKDTKTVYTYEDGSIKVTATLEDPTAVPDDATLRVTTIGQGSAQYDAYMMALNNSVSESPYNGDNTLLYDVKFEMAKDGQIYEVEPAEGSVRVKFEFKRQQLTEGIDAESAADVEVTHLPEVGGTIAAEHLDTIASGNSSITVTTDSFSVFAFSYTVDFTYDGYAYSFPGQGSYALADVLAALGINDAIDSAELTLVQGLAIEGDLYLTQPNGVWHINSDVPFTSTYKLSVKCGNTTYVITVTDVQESSDLRNFLTNATITGATQNSEGKYEVEQGKDYSIILTFAESSSHQFDNDANLTYTMPAGIKIISEQNGPTKINIVYKGRTYQVDATYHLDTSGNLTVKFDESDPDYPRLEESTNVSFRFTYNAQFDGSSTEIMFNDGIERDIIFDEPEPGQAYANKSATYDETTGRFNYTITVSATGDVTNVNVKDVISGDALIFNNDVQISGYSGDYTKNSASNGFDYTFASMHEGEVITITYSANVDFSKDTDGDGKITVDQTKNTVTVKPDGGDPHNGEYSREISFKSTVKSDGTEVGTTEGGDKIISWSIDYNQLALASAHDDTITDTISASSTQYMKYYGSGIKVEVRDHSGNLVRTDNVPYENMTAHSDSSWTYTIPTSDRTPYSYHITYETVVDMKEVNKSGVIVSLSNDGNGDYGGVNITPENAVDVVKDVESFTTEEVNWVATLSIPEDGLSQAVVTDTLPRIWLNGANHYDVFDESSLSITGLLRGESYSTSVNQGSVVINFYKDSAKTQTGLQGTPGGHTITVRLTTKVDDEWLRAGYEVSNPDDLYIQDHTNTINLNGKTDTAKVTFGKPGIKKTGESLGDGSFKYTVVLSGVSDTPVSLLDTFDTSLLEVDTSKASEWDHMRIWGGSQHSQDTGRMAISYSEASNGVVLTANSVPMQADGTYYPYYRICYYLKLKDGVDLEQLAIANGGEHHLINTAKWGDHESEFDYKTEYEYLNKELLNAGELGGTDRTAQYRITFNSAKATLNSGEPMEMTDTLSSNLSVDYSSIQITTDPAGVSVPYSLKGGEKGTTVATYTVPDSTKVVITYNAEVRGNGSQKITNKVVVNGKEDTVENTHDYGSSSEGQGAIASFKIVKVDGYDANKKLEGVQFKIFAEKSDLDFGVGANHAKEITLTTDENGEIILDGAAYDFYFDEVYHVQEVEAPEDYGNIGFDYLVTLTNDMSKVDYGHYVYYYSDAMQIKNWPLEGLVVEKRVESDDAGDLERYYEFKVSILREDGSVDTSYNEKNGDDQFENGEVTFELKNNEQKMFWGFAKGTRYKVEEVLTGDDGSRFTTTVDYDVFDEEGNVTSHQTEDGISHSGTLTQSDETIVFTNKNEGTGGLKIKKTVTENNSTTLSDAAKSKLAGTYVFTLYTDEACSTPYKVDGADATVSITIPPSGEAVTSEEVTNLPAGDYWIKETEPTNGSKPETNPVKVTVEAGSTGEQAVIAEFTNNIETGSLKITKNVTVNDAATSGTLADGTYTFKVAGPDDFEETVFITIVDGKSTSATLDGLVPGTYTVTEDVSRNPANMRLVSANGVEVTVEEGKTSEVKTAEFTNNIMVGDLEVSKKVESPFDTDKTTSKTFSFTVSLLKDDGSVDTSVSETYGDMTFVNGKAEFTLSDGQVKKASGIPQGTKFSVEETSDSAFTVEPSSGEVTGMISSIVSKAEFTNTRKVGGLKLTKVVTVDGQPATQDNFDLVDGDYTFMISGPEAYSNSVTLTVKDGVVTGATEGKVENGSAVITDLVPGEYTITETAPSNGTTLVGDNPVTVTVAAGDTVDASATALFTNDYDTVDGEILAEKVLEGRNWATDDSFEFTIAPIDDASAPEETTVTITKSSLADGKYIGSFGGVHFTKPGTYQWKVSETHKGETIKGVTYDSADKTVTIVVTRDATGKLVADTGSNLVQTASFKNVYDATGGFTLTGVTKKLEGRTIGSTKFSFQVTDASGNVVATGQNDSTGAITFTYANGKSIPVMLADLDKNNDGSYAETALTYTISETSTDGGGITVDKNTYDFTVTAKDNASGTILINDEDVPEVDPKVTLVNTYESDGKGKIEAMKHISGRSITDYGAGVFQFKLTGPNVKDGSEIQTNDANGLVSFTEIQFTQQDFAEVTPAPDGSRTKTFTYTITEIEPTVEVKGMAFDGHTETVTITVVDKGDGSAFSCTTNYDDDGSIFTNTYAAEGTAQLFAEKDLSGRELKSGEFEFTLAGHNVTGDSETVANDANGRAVFTTIDYTLDDLDKKTAEGVKYAEYTYTINEVIPNDADKLPGVTYDTRTVQVKVTLTDSGDGTIKTEYTGVNVSSLTLATINEVQAAGSDFINEYDASGDITFGGEKTLEGRDFIESDPWSFDITAIDGAPLVDADGNAVSTATITKTTGNEKDYSFTLHYDLADLLNEDGKTYASSKEFKYTVTENGADSNVTNDSTPARNITVKVTDPKKGDGTLKVELSEGASNLDFVNTYDAKGEIAFGGQKVIENRDFQAGDEWTFTIKAADGGKLPVDSGNQENSSVTIAPTSGTTADVDFGTFKYTLLDLAGSDTKTFTYEITESGTVEGVTNDSVPTKTIQVKVTDEKKADGKLKVELIEGGDTAEFVNTYDADGDITLGGTKKLEGRELTTTDRWTFTLTAKDGAPLRDDPEKASIISKSVKNDGGSYDFGTFYYLLSDLDDVTPDAEGKRTKTFEYTIDEAGTIAGVVNDTNAERSVKVTVTDDGTGKLTVTKDEGSDSLEFVNTYTAKGSIVIKGEKSIDVGTQTDLSGFEFILSGNGINQTATTDTDGKFEFSALEYEIGKDGVAASSSKDFTYTLTEANRDGYVTLDPIDVTVTVKDSATGELTVTSDMPETGYKLVNKHEATGSITFSGTKTIDKRDLTEDDIFTFEVVENGAVIATATNDATGKINYPTISYVLNAEKGSDDLGEHTYTVREAVVDSNGIKSDTSTYTVKVVVTDNGTSELTVTPSEEFSALNFVNTYDATGTATLSGAKDITGREFKEGDSATIKIEALTSGAPMPEDASGSVVSTVTVEPTSGTSAAYSFPAITYEIADIPEGEASATFEYKVTEDAYSMQGVGEKDSTEYTVEVTISDNGDGTLNVVTSDNATGLNFVNAYDANGSVGLEAHKDLTGRPLEAGQFTFTASGKVGERDITMTAKNDADGNVKFPDIEFGLADQGEYEFTITEVVPTDAVEGKFDGYTYDGHAEAVSIIVVDNTDGTLSVTAKYTGEQGAVFSNSYDTKGEITLSGKKVLVNRTLKEGEFRFDLYDGDGGLVESVFNAADGSYAFSALKFTADDLDKDSDGNFVETTKTYKVTERPGNDATITYDETEYDVTITLVDDGKGTIKATADPAKDTYAFTNTYNAKGELVFSAKKVANAKLGDKTFRFELLDSKGAVVATSTAVKQGETATFPAIPVTLSDLGGKSSSNITYRIREVIPAGATKDASGKWVLDNIVYDDHVETVIVTVVDAGDGTLNISYNGEPKLSTPEFANTTIDETAVSIKKQWIYRGTVVAWPSGVKVTVALMADGTKVAEHTLTANAPSYTFMGLPKTNADGTEIVYTVAEVSVSGLTNKYSSTVTGSAAKGFLIKNRIKTIPQTGDLFDRTLAVTLAFAGMGTLVGGLTMRRRKERQGSDGVAK